MCAYLLEDMCDHTEALESNTGYIDGRIDR